MQDNFYDKVEQLLKTDARFVDREGELLKSVVIDKAYKADEKLVELLATNKEIRDKFFRAMGTDGNTASKTAKRGSVLVMVFDINAFADYIRDKNFLNDSYTKYRNKIGLTIDNKFLNERAEVALAWPFKDCVLEGGQTRDDAKRKELFFNETLAHSEIDKLFAPKVLTNWKRYTKDGAQSLAFAKGEAGSGSLKRDADGVIRENLIIKGNNLLALHCLKKQFQNKVKLIYIDPPYNTGNDSFGYNDNFNHSTWLTFMKNRLEAARELLREDGSIWINIDDGEAHYLKVLGDEIFGRENFVNNLIWNKKNVVQNDARFFNENHDHILLFAKNKEIWRPNLLERTEEMNARYENPDDDPRGVWTSVALQAKSGTVGGIYEIDFPNGVKWKPVEGTFPRLNKASLIKAYNEGRLWFGKSGKNVPRLKKYLSEVKQGLISNTIFVSSDVGSTQQAKEDLKKILDKNIFTTPKPEKLLQRILQIGSNEGDIILDFFAGSGTTGAAAMKMKRQFILIEQMDYVDKVTVERLQKVIKGEQGGISEAVNWKGGGDFIYCELMKYNEAFIEKIQKAKTTSELLKIWDAMKEKSFLNYNVDIEKLDETIADFKKLPFPKQQQTLFDLLNKNQIYVNLSEIEDEEFGVGEGEKRINGEFY